MKNKRNKLMTVTNYAKQIGVSKQGVYRRVKDKTIPHRYIDGVPFIKVNENK